MIGQRHPAVLPEALRARLEIVLREFSTFLMPFFARIELDDSAGAAAGLVELQIQIRAPYDPDMKPPLLRKYPHRRPIANHNIRVESS